MRRHLPVLLVASGFVALLAAWVVATPPFDAPDEASHYLRALSLANGTLVDRKVPYVNAGLTPSQLAWASGGTTAVLVPPRLAPPGINCLRGRPDIGPGDCSEATEVGDYQPLPYLLPAAGIAISPDFTTALWLGRLASALQSLAFLLLALVLIWSGSALSLAGLLAAVTPLVLFAGSIINPNGLQIAAGLALTCAVLRASRSVLRTPRWVWVALAISQFVTLVAWQLGPVFVAADLVLALGLLGRTGLRQLRRVEARSRLAVTVSLLAGLCAYVIYGAAAGASHVRAGVSPVGRSLHDGITQLPGLLESSVGVFGSLTVTLPTVIQLAWGAAILLLAVAALWVSRRWGRVLLVTVVLAALVFPVLFYAWVYRFTGFLLQARYVIPMLALVPLVAGELLVRRIGRGHERRWAWPFALGTVVLAGVQLYAWWHDASTFAGHPNTALFWQHAAYRPPLGWLPWTVLALGGTLALLSVALTLPIARHRPSHRPRFLATAAGAEAGAREASLVQ